MVERRRRKKNKLRGQRTMGAGNTKNRRGAGCRGGRGKAGSNKHRFDTFNRFKRKKYRLKSYQKIKEIQLGKIDSILDELVSKGKVKKEGTKYIVDKKSGYTKILGQGEATHQIILRINATKKAISKIIKAGGRIEYNKEGLEKEDAIFSGLEDEEIEFEEVKE